MAQDKWEGRGWLSFDRTVATALYRLDEVRVVADVLPGQDAEVLAQQLADVTAASLPLRDLIDAAVTRLVGHGLGDCPAGSFSAKVEDALAALDAATGGKPPSDIAGLEARLQAAGGAGSTIQQTLTLLEGLAVTAEAAGRSLGEIDDPAAMAAEAGALAAEAEERMEKS